MNKLNFAVALLLANVSAISHRKHDNMYLQFIDGDFAVESLNQVSSEKNSQAAPVTSVAQTEVESDPIHGSLGPPVVPLSDLYPEAQFEEQQRKKVPRVYTPEVETVLDTQQSIRAAEQIVGVKFPGPDDPEEVRRQKIEEDNGPLYHYAEEDEEDQDTIETRRSIKQAEKQLMHRFFINAKEEREYNKALADGLISEREANFEEGDNEKIGPNVNRKKEEELQRKKEKKLEDERKKAIKILQEEFNRQAAKEAKAKKQAQLAAKKKKAIQKRFKYFQLEKPEDNQEEAHNEDN